jgi:omega-6 fatty acid desaturase (delta-12 desaturase)
MNGESALSVCTGKELHNATRQFAKESRAKSWWYTGSTFVLLAIALTVAGMIPWWPVRVACSVLGGLLLVRAFILYHDFLHGALLRQSWLGRVLFGLYGLVALTPTRYWRHSHNFHHANVGKPIPVEEGNLTLLTSDVGALPLMTTEMWQQASFWRRFHYRISRHPITILCAYITVFLFSICLFPLLKNPRKYWDGAVSLGVHAGIIAAIWILAGFQATFFAFLLPLAIAAASGAYLFFAQHNFEGLRVLPAEEWSHFQAALESSSYMRMGPIMNWFTGNIGYHHVHHLNALIPFYRLPEALNAIPELQSPVVTTLSPRDIFTCLSLSLWDSSSKQLVTYRTAERQKQMHNNQ